MDREESKRGRPADMKVNAEEVRRMSALGCTYEEIAQKFQVSRQCIENAYVSEYQAGKVELKEGLRAAQIRCAKEGVGNSSMLIWLGKIHLNQREVSHEERISELDMLIKHLDLKAECLNSQRNSLEATMKQQLD